MFYCLDCEKFFENPVKLNESDHSFGIDREIGYYCPCCKSSRIKKTEVEYCRCCGKRLRKDQHIYCSVACLKNGERLYKLQRERKKKLHNSPVYVIVRQLKEYNKKHKTNLSYGQFVAGAYV